MNNMEIYNAVQAVPQEAKKEIKAGRLKGMTDINPQWRIETLTKTFGAVGFGWYYTINRQWLEESPVTNEIAAFCNISLFVKYGGEWSQGIEGTGGSRFVSKETNGFYCSDEAFKMALTDALSVSCKALGIGADVYWAKSETKYSKNDPIKTAADLPTKEQMDELKALGVTDLKGVANWRRKPESELTSEDIQAAIDRKKKEAAK